MTSILFVDKKLQSNSIPADFSTHTENELTKESLINDPFSEGYEGEFYEPDEWSELMFS
ncbi:hypothetical protein [Enterococcus sp. AZ101]|uniref:hypothetical protein n=1 Tax=unclassified Enterococcus TaxID=2608891 RepID=UPI003D2BD9EA